MRVSKEAMARHHDAIISAASKMFRERGIEGVSVADLMHSAGLTHGGFYRHFASKEALVAEAIRAAFDGILRMLKERSARVGEKAALSEYVADYLSTWHLMTPGSGCPIAAFGTDVARSNPAVRAAFDEGVSCLLGWIEAGLTCHEHVRRARAVELLTMMVGSIVTARAAGDSASTRSILLQAHECALKQINEES